jgi:ferredoxin-NADP reductase
MAVSPPAASQAADTHDHGFHEMRVREVIRETDDACSFVLDPPVAYKPGQFITLRVRIDGEPLLRSYSMSSAPAVDDDFKVTVKRVPGGAVSNWLIDNLAAGAVIEATRPTGVFCLPEGDGPVVAFAGGSGITPVISILKTTGARPARLLYANRDRDSIIFDKELQSLDVDVVHHLDVEDGFVTADDVRPFITPDGEYFICGPGPFMDIVEGALLDAGVDASRIHIERFTPAPPPAVPVEADATTATRVTIEVRGRTETTDHYPGTTILQTARQAGLTPPSSCEAGNCATCMAKLVAGEVTMFVNDVLTDDELAEGWILTCQSVPTTPTVHVVYEDM